MEFIAILGQRELIYIENIVARAAGIVRSRSQLQFEFAFVYMQNSFRWACELNKQSWSWTISSAAIE
jgi:hypothetical protein